MISVICAANNEEVLHTALLPSLEKQTDVSTEVITVNAQEHGFTSAAETLNYGASKAKGELLVFVHQDVVFEEETVLSRVEAYYRQYEFGIAGVAGVLRQGDALHTVTNIHHGKDHLPAGAIQLENGPVAVDSLDECMLVIPAKVFRQHPFSDLGQTWHLYGTDYALKMKQEHLPVLVLPIDLWHLSEGASLNGNYFDAIWNLACIYRNQVSRIDTIFGTWPTEPLRLKAKCSYRKLRLQLKGV
jgi:hypothetical protein